MLQKVVPLDDRQGSGDGSGEHAPPAKNISEQFNQEIKATMKAHECSRDKAEVILAQEKPDLFKKWVESYTG